MGRSSSTGFPFLIERTDSHKFVYNRVLPTDIAPFVAGVIEVDWLKKKTRLAGRTVIKLSLKTGDPATAKDRWVDLHAQVQVMVREAEKRVRAEVVPGYARMVGTLEPSAIRQMAGQVKHDILATDDRSWSDPRILTPTGEVVLDILRKSGRVDRVGSYGDARRIAEDAHARVAERHLGERDIGTFDQRIQEGEMSVDDAVRDAILARPRPVATRAMTQAEKQRFLGAAEKEQLLKEPAKDLNLLPSDVDAILAENEIELPKNNPDRHKLALAILRAEVNAYRTVHRRRNGDTAETPDRPAKVEMVPQGETISAMRLKWINELQPGQKAIDDNALYVRRFIDRNGDMPIGTITRKIIIGFRDALAMCPRNPAKSVAKGSLQAQIASAAAKPGCRLLTRQTVNAKGIGSISTLLRVAIKHGDLTTNVCDGTAFPLDGHAMPRDPYSDDDLNRIFTSPVYTTGKRWVAGGGEAQFWFPLIGLFAGARLEEIGQLLVDDVRTKGRIAYFDFIDTDVEAEAAGVTTEKKKIKTPNARREVPVHPILIDLGFLRYVARMREAGLRRLFPQLVATKGKFTHNWSKWWGRYADAYVTKSAQKVYHSFRHNFSDGVRNVTGGNEEVVAALIGHSRPMYGRAISLETRYEIICKLEYPGVDFSTVEAAARKLYGV